MGKKRHFESIFDILKKDVHHEWHMIDRTMVRADQHAVGAMGGQENQALGRSCVDFSSKIHIKVDTLGLPLKFILTAGEEHESKFSKALFNKKSCEYICINHSSSSPQKQG